MSRFDIAHSDLSDSYYIVDTEKHFKYDCTEAIENIKRQVRADAIDGLVKMVCEYYTMCERSGYYSDTNVMIKQRITDFAEQMKEIQR